MVEKGDVGGVNKGQQEEQRMVLQDHGGGKVG